MENKSHSIQLVTENGLYKYHPSSFVFSAGEVQVNVCPPDAITERVVEIFVGSQTTSSDQVVELIMLADAIFEYFGEDIPLYLILPYLPYSRQDRVCAVGEANGLKTFLGLIKNAGFTRVWTSDVHNHEAVRKYTEAVCNAPAYVLIGGSEDPNCQVQDDERIILNDLQYNLIQGRYTIISPDAGAVERANEVAKFFKSDIVYATKVRDPGTGHIVATEVPDVDIQGERLLIVDDICDGGRTFIELAKKLKEKNPSRIDLYVTHGIFSKGLDVFDGHIDHIYTTGSFPAKYYDRDDPRITNIGKWADE